MLELLCQPLMVDIPTTLEFLLILGPGAVVMVVDIAAPTSSRVVTLFLRQPRRSLGDDVDIGAVSRGLHVR